MQFLNGIDGKNWKRLLEIFIAEFIGTMSLLVVGCGSCIAAPSSVAPCLGFGFVVTTAISIVGHISGCHINPTVTITFLVYKKIDLVTALVCVLAQILGAITGTLIQHVSTPEFLNSKNLCITSVPPHGTVTQALIVEIVITFILNLIVCSVLDPRNATHTEGNPFKFGITVAGNCLGGAMLTGGSMNPARSFGPALIHGNWENHWVFWIGPIVGGLLAAYGYKLCFLWKKAAGGDPSETNF